MTTIDALDRIRFDVERDPAPGELVNLIPNQSGELGGWGWITPVAGSAMKGGTSLVYSGVTSVANYFTSELVPVVPGQYVAATWTNLFRTGSGLARARLVWCNAAGDVIASGVQTGYQQVAGSYAIGATVVPAGAVQVALRFDVYGNTSGANPTISRSLYLTGVTLATAATAAQLLRTRANLVPNPSFEAGVTNWTPLGSALTRSTFSAAVGSACGQVAPAPSVVTNLCPNPSFEANATGWSVGSGASTAARAAGGARVGSYSLQVTTDSVVLHGSSTAFANGPMMTGVTAGRTYYFPYAVDHIPPSGRIVSAASRAILRWYNSTGAQVGGDVAHGPAALGTDWLARTFSATAPAGATQARLFIGIDWSFDATFSSATTSTTFRVDTVGMLTANVGYFDGSQADTSTYQYSWSGTSGLSASTRTELVTIAGIKTPELPVTPGVAYTASASFRAASVARATTISYEWRNGTGTLISLTSSQPGSDAVGAWTRRGRTQVAPAGAASLVVTYGLTVNTFSSSEIHYIDAAMVEASSTVDTYFDGDTADTGSWTYSWSGSAGASASRAVSTNTLISLPSAYYVSIIAESASLVVERQELNMSTLTGTIVSASLDPSESTLLRPGRHCRLMVDVSADGSGDWEPIFTGRTKKADVEYRLLQADEEKRAIITLTAVDALTRLAQEPRPDGVGTIAELPYVLEGCGVPWNVNGSGNQVPSAAVVASNDQATAVDQVAVTRDSNGGFAWVDRRGVLKVFDTLPPSNYVPNPSAADGTATGWSAYGLNTAIGVAVEGSQHYFRITKTAAGSQMGMRTSPTVTGLLAPRPAGTQVTISAEVRNPTGQAITNIGFIARDDTNADSAVLGSIVDGAMSTTVPANNTWTRIHVTGTVTAGRNLEAVYVQKAGTPALSEVLHVRNVSVSDGELLDEDDYTTDLGITFATDRVINQVSFDAYEVNPATGDTGTAQYGPYRDEVSIAEWKDVYEKTFTVQGLTETQIAALAQAILAANSTPTRRFDYITLALTEETIGRATLDLYDAVLVSNDRANLHDSLRIVGVTHTITATKKGASWSLRLDFAGDGSVAPPQVIPKPSGGSSALATAPQQGLGVSVGALAVGATQSIAVTFPHPYATRPIVHVSPFNSRLSVGYASITTAGFTVSLSNWSTGTMPGTTFDWDALPA